MKGKSIWELFPDLKGTIVERELRSVIQDHMQVSFEFYYLKDQRWYESKAIPLRREPYWCFETLPLEKPPRYRLELRFNLFALSHL